MNHLPTLPRDWVATTKVYSSRKWLATMHHYPAKFGPVIHITAVGLFGHNEVYIDGRTAIELGASFLEWGDEQPELEKLFRELNEELRL